MKKILTIEQRIARLERLIKEDNNTVEVVRWSSMNYDGEVIGDANSAKEACSVIVKDLLEIDEFFTAAEKVWLPGERYYKCGWSEVDAMNDDEVATMDIDDNCIVELDMYDDSPCYTLRMKNDNELYATIVLSASMVYDVSFDIGEPTYVPYGEGYDLYDDGIEVKIDECYLRVKSAEVDEYSDDTLNSWAEEIANSLLKSMYAYWY